MPRKLTILPILLLLAGCTLQPITEPRRPDPTNEPTPVATAAAVEKPTYVVESGTVIAQQFMSGGVAPVKQARHAFAVSGQVAELFVDRDDIVAVGDRIARLDTATPEQALESAEATLALAEAQLAIAAEGSAAEQQRAEITRDQIQLRLDFARERAGDNPTPEQTLAINLLMLDLEMAQLSLDELDNSIDPTLAAQVTQTQLLVDEIKAELEKSDLLATTVGQLISVNVDVGDTVLAEETVAIVADLTSLEVNAQLAERDLLELAEGMIVVGFDPEQPTDPISMTIRQLPYPYGSGDQEGEADGSVIIAFDDPAMSEGFRPGDRVRMAAQLEQHQDVLWLPPAAVREFNGRHFVVILDGRTQKRVDVNIGLQNEEQFEIESGVSAGQVVLGP